MAHDGIARPLLENGMNVKSRSLDFFNEGRGRRNHAHTPTVISSPDRQGQTMRPKPLEFVHND
jgi:hypothetical protein